MPEGDTIHTIARLLREQLVGQTVQSLIVRSHGRVASLEGQVIDAIQARGKHLLISIAEAVVHVHLGMDGAWYERAGPPSRRGAEDRLWVEITTPRRTLRCLDARVAELLRRDRVEDHPALKSLGPDLLDEAEPDWPAVLERARRDHAASITDVLFDQKIVSGLGNIYRCELLFLFGLKPSKPAREVSDETLLAMLQEGRRLLRFNLGRLNRQTREQGGTWVHGRQRKTCHRCGKPVRHDPPGADGRWTWWCPRCQR
ncbi:MAG: formamidopyrimidine DNA glycosylase [Planctomycetes bacterium]|nr:formamidopyrimidine DNA glycosylase [Planctomycetota bacterium]